MKQICKKIITSLLVVVLLINFVFTPYSMAGSGNGVRDAIVGLLGTFIGVITWIPRAIMIALGYAIDMLASGIAYVDGTVGGASTQLFITPFEIVFNETAITNVDFFDFEGVGEDTVVFKIRSAVSGWYYFMRLIAVAILLVILVYVGIRMAITTIAEDKAKYKKMLVDWLASLALVFVLQYIMVFFIGLSNALVAAMSASRPDTLDEALNEIAVQALGASVEGIGATIVFLLFIFQTFSILFAYINRMIRVAFLIIIAPLITITYSIDKMGDGKAQALNQWLTQFVTSILIQPFHCIIYMVFVSTAIDLLSNPDDTGTSRLASSVIAILCMMFINDAEKIVRNIFNLKGDDNSSAIAAGAAVAGAALHKSKDIGKAARKGVNMAKEMKPIETGRKMGTEIRSAAKASFATLKGGKDNLGFKANYQSAKANIEQKREEKQERKLEKTYKKNESKYTQADKDKIAAKAEEIKKQPGNENMSDETAKRKAQAAITKEKKQRGDFAPAPIRGVRSAARKVKKIGRDFANTTTGQVLKKNFTLAVGLTAGGLALGSEDVFTAAATAGAVKKSTEEFMNTSNSFIANEAADYGEALGYTLQSDYEKAHADYKSGKAEKDRDDSEEALEKQLRGQFPELDDDQINDILANMRTAMAKDPNKSNLTNVLSQTLDKSVSEIESKLNLELEKAMQAFKDATAKVALGQTMDKGTSFGASIPTISREIADRTDNSYPTEQEKLNIRTTVREEELTEERVKEIVTKISNMGDDPTKFIEKLKADKSRLSSSEQAKYGSHYDNNIALLEAAVKNTPK